MTDGLLTFEWAPLVPILDNKKQVPEDLNSFVKSEEANNKTIVIAWGIYVNEIDQDLLTDDKRDTNTCNCESEKSDSNYKEELEPIPENN